MTQDINKSIPAAYERIDEATKALGFTMASDRQTCSLLKTLAASKPASRFLELGTGTGLSTAWILAGMDAYSSLISVDNEAAFLGVAERFLGQDERLSLVHSDGGNWIEKNNLLKFDYLFADTWPGKYHLLDEAISMLNPGGFYIIDDMMPQPNWPDGHEDKALNLLKKLEAKTDLIITRQVWATGIVIGVKL